MAVHKTNSTSRLAEGEVAREAQRIFRYLEDSNARLTAIDGQWFALHHGARLERRVRKVAADIVERFVRNGWLARSDTRDAYLLSDAGRGWLARLESRGGDPFQAQHQLRVVTTIADRERIGVELEVRKAEDPLGWLLYRRVVTEPQYAAGERLRRDFTFAKVAPRMGIDLEAPVILKSHNPVGALPDLAIAAGQRFRNAMRSVGPGLSDLTFDVCCALKGLEEVELARGWPRRSAKVVLGLALDRLAEHYGIAMTGPARAGARSWTANNKGEGG